MAKLILVRHGETIWNQQRRIQGGSSDIELSELGKRQAENLAVELESTKLDAIYSSPLRRALDTAKAIANSHKLSVRIEANLKEIETGDLEGMPLDNLNINFSQFILDWQQDKDSAKLPGGESLIDVGNRVWPVIQRIVNESGQGAVVVVSHYFVIVTTICYVFGLSFNHITQFRINVGSMSIFNFENKCPCLITLNDTCYLRGTKLD